MPTDETEDLTGVMWSDKVWLSYFPLDKSTVLDYFSLSQFYDIRCNNELVKMQKLDPTLLQTMEGIEYTLVNHETPGLFIITKSRRTLQPPKLETLATYYILDGNVYQAPSMHAILSSRILQSVHHLRKAFEAMQNATRLSSQGRYVWDPPPVPGEEGEDDIPAVTELVSGSEKRAIDSMLFDIMQKNSRIAEEQEEKMRTAAEKQTEGEPAQDHMQQ